MEDVLVEVEVEVALSSVEVEVALNSVEVAEVGVEDEMVEVVLRSRNTAPNVMDVEDVEDVEVVVLTTALDVEVTVAVVLVFVPVVSPWLLVMDVADVVVAGTDVADVDALLSVVQLQSMVETNTVRSVLYVAVVVEELLVEEMPVVELLVAEELLVVVAPVDVEVAKPVEELELELVLELVEKTHDVLEVVAVLAMEYRL